MLKKIAIIAVLLIISIYPFLNANNEAAKDILSAVKNNNKLAFKLLNYYRQKQDKNIFLSPWSITSALSMTYEGAKADTKEEMEKILYFVKDSKLRQSSMAKLFNKLNYNDSTFELKTANALFLQQDFDILNSYTKTINEYYKAKIEKLNFADEDNSRKTINSWVEDKTNDKIKELIPKKAIDKLTKLVLVNAIYFKSSWQYQFDPDKTSLKPFYVDSNNSVKAPFMFRQMKKNKLYFYENNKVQILELPYKAERLSMQIILPKDNAANINLAQLNQWTESLRLEKIKIYIPKFKFKNKYMMKNSLKDMGMKSSFSNAADFSGITGSKDLKISEVIHQSFIEVNEEGTEASAATAITMARTTQSMYKKFKVDRPFIFLIKDNSTGLIIFIGYVKNPLLND